MAVPQLSPAALLQQLHSYINDPPLVALQDESTRSSLYAALQSAVRVLECPPNPVARVFVTQHAEWAVISIGCDIGLFPALGKDRKTANELYGDIKAEPALVLRILRAAVAFGAVQEVDAGIYRLSPTYEQFADPATCAAVSGSAEFIATQVGFLPELLRRNGSKQPTDPANTAIQLANNAFGKMPYDIVQGNPRVAKAIGPFMGLLATKGAKKFENVYPVVDRLVHGFKSDAFFVDVGAGSNHVAAGIKEALDADGILVPGRMIAQDLPHMLPFMPEDPLYEKMAHDFFTEQPIHGARCYYMRHTLHNWQDAEAHNILIHLFQAMQPGYSRLIIHEQVMLEHKPDVWACTVDIDQMAACATSVRTEKEWRAVLQGVGFEDEGITVYWPSDPSAEACIEAIRS